MGLLIKKNPTSIQMGKDDKFILYARKIINNPLLKRKQIQVELVHPETNGVSKTEIKDKLANMFKDKGAAEPERIAVFGLHAKFGGGRSTGFALIYDSVDDRKKYDQKLLLRRDGLYEKTGPTRKMKKEMKGRMKKVRGTAKAKAAKASGKKGK